MKKYKDYIIIIVILSLIFISIIVLNKLDDEKNMNFQQKSNYILETNYSKFFTVNSCISKYISYLEKKDTNSLLEILDKDYVKNNNINKDNLYNFVDNIDGSYSFVSRKMFRCDKQNLLKYYVYGFLNKETIDGVINKKEQYYILTLDEENYTFSIIPSSFSQYMEVQNG